MERGTSAGAQENEGCGGEAANTTYRKTLCRVQGIQYNLKLGAVDGNTSEKMILVSVVVSSQLISKSSLVFQIQPLQIRVSKSMAIFHP